MIIAVCVTAALCMAALDGEATVEEVLRIPDTASEFALNWGRYPAGIEAAFSDDHDGPTLTLRIEEAEDARVTWNQLSAASPARPGQRFEAAAVAEGVGTYGGNGVGVSLGFYDAEDKRIAHVDTIMGPGDTGRRETRMWAEAPPHAAAVKILLLLHGFGEALFSKVRVTCLPKGCAPPGAEDVDVFVTDDVVAELIGFGFEDDGWFYNAHNAERGVDEAAITLREERIAWMEPDYVRMFFWYMDWNPSGDFETFTWESDNMLSHYRTLDLYQRLGARVNVCGVEWAVKEPWRDPERLAYAVGALLEHLIVERGYSCIQDYTLTNEPDIFFARAVERDAEDFDTFVRLHVEVAKEFERRGLDINIVGSDDGNNRAWFSQAVADDLYFSLADLFASHFYFAKNTVPLAGHILADRVELLRARTPVKPFIVAELGFSDERTQPPSINPLMREYAYAMLAMSTFLDGLNVGTVGWSIWCVHEMYYPGADEPMRFGLWDFDPPEWPVRPIYHALALMTRHTKTGDAIYRCDTSHPDWVKAARVGDHVFWVNLSEAAVTLRLAGASISEVRAHTETTLTHDRDCARVLTLDNKSTFVAPERSFGVAALQ